ncbi:hypothetical protein GCM10023187_27140 [Nibrella viscosa]|uniref:Uncharacterized protein n=1 Tax=Nibrella viscosa TaxID=1084524 RepID=A0ABP8KHW7_9BACT
MKLVEKFEIIELEEFTGNGAAIYSIALGDDEETLFDRFVKENENTYPDEINSIVERLKAIARLGARPGYFKDKEGRLGMGDGIEALYDEPNSNLRLYCIRYGTIAIILGGGGFKSKEIRAFQEDAKLTEENYLLRTISIRINKAIKEGVIQWDGNCLTGDLLIDDTDA